MTGKGAKPANSGYISSLHAGKRCNLKILVLLFSVFAFSVSLGFAQSVDSASITDADYFYSSSAGNNVIHVSATATLTGTPPGQYVEANFTNLTTSCGTGGYVTLTLNGSHYDGECDVSSVAAVSDFTGGYVSVYPAYSGGAIGSPIIIQPIVLYNMTRPVSNDPCIQFASSTTDMSQELNFNSVNFLVDVLVNGSAACNSGTALPWGDGFTSMPSARLSFTGLNMTDASIGDKLTALSSAISVVIPAPRSFGLARIYVNSSAFAELNTVSTITLYNLPFTSQPDVTDDPGAAGHGSITWSQGGYDMGYNSSRGNLTIVVNGFSGYNANDSTPPAITFNNPANGSVVDSSSMVVYNVTLNGTGTEISAAIFNLTKVNGSNVAYFNSTNNSANCTAASDGSEIYYCIFTLDAMGTGDRNLAVAAYDYGGGAAPGNGATNSISFAISQAPNVNLLHPNATEVNYTSGTIPLNFTADGNGLDSCWYWYDAGSPAYISPCVASTQYNYSLTIGDGSHVIYVRANNSYGLQATRNSTVMVDTTGPSIGPFTSPQPNSFTGLNRLLEVNASATDATSGIPDGSACAVAFMDGTGNVSGYTGSVAYASSTNTCSGVLNLTGTGSEGDVSLALNVSDSFGNTNVSDSVVIFIDNTSPELAVSNPMPDGMTGLLNVSLTVSDNLLANGSLANTSVSVADYFNGTQAASASKYVSGLGFIEISGISDGSYNITVTAMDKAGNLNTTLITNVTVHSTPPTVAIQAPADGANVSVNATPLQFTASDPVGITSCEYSIDYNSTHISLPGCNNSTANVTDGSHAITVYAIDSAGNQGNATVSFTVDATAPNLAITYPADNILLSSTPLMVNYSVYDAHINMTTLSLIDYFNGSVADTAFNGTSGNHTALLNVSDGRYNITATATDFFGHSTTVMVSNITYDTVAPNVTVSSPSSGQYNSTPIELNFTAFDSFTSIDSCWYVLNNATQPIALCENTTINSSLVQGSNNLTVFANDSAGNVGSANAMFGFDNASPSLSILSPTDNAFMGLAPIEVNYSVYDPNMNSTSLTLLYYVNGSVVSQNVTSGNGNYSVLFNASDGQYNITAVATDMFGNAATAAATNLTLDTAAPEISIQLPAEGAVYSTSAPLNYTVYDSTSGINTSSCSYTLDGLTIVNLPGCANSSLTGLSQGMHNLTMTVRDMAGNSNTTQRSFSVDATGPIVNITAPSNLTYGSANLTLSFTVSDSISSIDTCWYVADSGNATFIANCTNTTFTVSGDGTHNVSVYSNDSVGNVGYDVAAFAVDSTAPVVNVTSPISGNNYTNNELTLAFMVNESQSSLASCKYSIDAGSNTTVSSCANGANSLTLPIIADGWHNLTVFATDSVGNNGSATATMFNINTSVVVDNTTTNVTAGSNSSQIVLSNTSANVTITVPSNVTNVTLNLTSVTVNSSATITNSVNVSANTSLGVIGLSLPPNVTITGTNWTGGLSLPSVTTVPTANITASSGMSVSSVDAAVVVGFTQGLNLSSAARLLIPGKAGKYAGYIDSSGTFHGITSVCTADTQAAGDSLAAGAECKIDSGSDLVIWTKHFTTFVAYSQSSTGGGSSGGSYVGAGSGGVGSFSSSSSSSESSVMFNGALLPYTSSVTVSPDNVTTVTMAIRNNQSYALKNFEVKIKVPESFTTDKNALEFNLAPDRFESGSIVPVWKFSLLNPGETLVLFFSANKPTLLTGKDFALSVVSASAEVVSGGEGQGTQPVLIEGSLAGPQSAYAGEQISVTFTPKSGVPVNGVVVVVTNPKRQVSEHMTDASGSIYIADAIEGQYSFALKDGVLSKAYSLTVMQKPSVQPSMPSAPTSQQETPAAGQQEQQSGGSNAGLILGLGGATLIIAGLVLAAAIVVAVFWLGGRKKKK